MSIEKEIIISPVVRKMLPNSLQTIKDFYSIDLETKRKIFQTLKTEDITFDEFKKKFFNNK
jgi:hypothetical protein